MNLLTLKERVRAQDRQLAPLPHHNGSRTSPFLPPPLSPTNRQRGATLLFTEVPRSGILRSSAGELSRATSSSHAVALPKDAPASSHRAPPTAKPSGSVSNEEGRFGNRLRPSP